MTLETLKNQPYSNYKMLSPEGILMTRTSEKKANWYISRGLAKWIDNETFQLNFIPNGNGWSHDPFFTEEIENHCVICGSLDELTKHHVVPYMFRKLFPTYCKYNHHDILIVCLKDHNNYERYADQLKLKLLSPYQYIIDEYNRVVSLNYKIEGYKKNYEKLKNNPFITSENMNKIKELADQPLVDVPDSWHSAFLNDYSNETKIHELFCLWRKHFVEYTNPKFLPKYWDINHTLESH